MNRFVTNGHAYYAVTPDVETAWRELLSQIGRNADIAFDFLSYPLPQPLEELWTRIDLGCVFMMCGYPIVMHYFEIVPIAAPIPAAPWAQGRALYRSDLIVKADSRFQTLPETFGTRFGWTVKHSHSGFNAPRHHLLQYRTPERPTLYSHVVGNLGSVRNVFDSVCDGTIDVGPIDAYWHMLLQRYHPELAARVRVLESTATAPIPTFVASPAVPHEIIDRLVIGFATARNQSWFRSLADTLMIDSFATLSYDEFSIIRTRDQEAISAGYPLPA